MQDIPAIRLGKPATEQTRRTDSRSQLGNLQGRYKLVSASICPPDFSANRVHSPAIELLNLGSSLFGELEGALTSCIGR